MSYPIPARPWQKIGADIFTHSNPSYLVISDAYLNWLEFLPIKTKLAKAVILTLRKVFLTYGLPDVCDNFVFTSYEFTVFAVEDSFYVVICSPNSLVQMVL